MKRAVIPFGDFLSLGRRGDEQPAKLSVPSALAPWLATLATAVGFSEVGQGQRAQPALAKIHRALPNEITARFQNAGLIRLRECTKGVGEFCSSTPCCIGGTVCLVDSVLGSIRTPPWCRRGEYCRLPELWQKRPGWA